MNNIKRNIKYDEASHTYRDEHNIKYTSVTTLIGQYQVPFDSNYWAEVKAKELNLTKEQVLQNWADITKFACDKGNATHKVLEDSINASNDNANLNVETNSFQRIYKGINVLSNQEIDIKLLGTSPLAYKYPEIFLTLLDYVENHGCKIYAEKRIYWAEYQIAGTIDCLLVKGKQFLIVDWKTNKDELVFKSGYFKKVNGIKSNTWVDKDERLLVPLTNIQKSKGSTYTLQLSLYALLMELWGFECIGLLLYHIRDNDKPKLYRIAYWKQDCQRLLIHHKNALTISNNNQSSMTFGIS